jgi:small basic protein
MMNDMPSLTILFERFGMALFLGLLIGLEREREKVDVFAGIRTFALISLLGAALAFVSDQFAPWTFIAGFLCIAAFAVVSHYQGYETGRLGITTEVATLLAFTLGGMVYWNMLALAAAITVVTVLLLTVKPDIQAIIAHINREDILAGVEFAIVWVVVLPLLPDQTFGPFDVLNPREIWLMVVFVSGVNLAGYIFSQIYAARHRHRRRPGRHGLQHSSHIRVRPPQPGRRRTPIWPCVRPGDCHRLDRHVLPCAGAGIRR